MDPTPLHVHGGEVERLDILQQEETANFHKRTGGRLILGDSGDTLALALSSRLALPPLTPLLKAQPRL